MNNITAKTFEQQLEGLVCIRKDSCTKFNVYRKSIVYLSNATLEKFDDWVFGEFSFLFDLDEPSLEKRISCVTQDGYIVEQDFDQERYNKLVSDYYVAKNKIDSDFRNYLYDKFDVVDNPKNLKCFELAWSYGYSSGYSEVENYFNELVELIK